MYVYIYMYMHVYIYIYIYVILTETVIYAIEEMHFNANFKYIYAKIYIFYDINMNVVFMKCCLRMNNMLLLYKIIIHENQLFLVSREVRLSRLWTLRWTLTQVSLIFTHFIMILRCNINYMILCKKF